MGKSHAMGRARELLELAAGFPSTVLLHGESGTGKELAARAIHELSPRKASPFVTVDCTVLTETLFESILFGHEKGSFSGAFASTTGLVRAADGGTLFLDEIGELPAPEQAKLLRLIQERTVLPVGGTRPVPVDIRIVAATHRDLPAMVLDGRFRSDLYYRLDVVRITLPSLRDHAADIPLIAAAILDRLNSLLGVRRTLSPAAVESLMLHAWPGNVRQLAACLERAAVTTRHNEIEPRDLGLTHLEPKHANQPLLKRSAAEAVRFALTEAQGNRAAAARRLGIGRGQLYRMIDRFGIDVPPPENRPSS